MEDYFELGLVILDAKMEGREEGRLLGLEEGREEGRLLGLKESREEGLKMIIRNMNHMGVDSEEIARLTGISMDLILETLMENSIK